MDKGPLENAREARQRLKAAYLDLFRAVSESLFKTDPMGINFESNTDEYDPEAGTILPRLSSCETEVDLLAVVHEEFTRWFGDSAGSICRYRDAASEIWRIWTDARMKL